MHANRTTWLAIGLAATLSLGACFGGGGGDDDTAADVVAVEVPESAAASSTAFVSYIQGLPATDEGSEPLLINATFTLPADDAAEPIPLT